MIRLATFLRCAVAGVVAPGDRPQRGRRQLMRGCYDVPAVLAALALLLFCAPVVRADSILLRGGERLIGKVEGESLDKITFASRNLGILQISRERIELIERDAPPPPPEVAAGTAPTAVNDSIVPAPPTVPVNPQQRAAAAAAPKAISPEPAALAAAPVAGPTMAELSALAMPEKTPVAPLAPKVDPVGVITPTFYPWSGLLTEEDTFDWVQLKSGEWLKGKIKSMQDDKLEFDSEKMDLREFDWEDILTVRSPQLNSLRFELAGTADGSLLIVGQEVSVVSKSGTETYPRADLLAITPTGERERNKWTGKLMFGSTIARGNTEEANYNAHVSLERRTPATRLSLDYLGNFSRINGTTTADNLRTTAQFDYFLSRKLYVRLPDAEYYRDPLQNIEQRYTLGASVGYDLVRKRRVEWDVSAGPAYQNTRFSSVEAGADPSESTVTLVLSTHADVQLTNKIDWIFDYRGQLTGKKSAGGNAQHANSTVEFEIHKRLKLDLSLIWDRVGSPKTVEDGTTPTPDDFRLITSLGIDF